MEQKSNGLNLTGKHEEAIAEAFKVYSLMKAITEDGCDAKNETGEEQVGNS